MLPYLQVVFYVAVTLSVLANCMCINLLVTIPTAYQNDTDFFMSGYEHDISIMVMRFLYTTQ